MAIALYLKIKNSLIKIFFIFILFFLFPNIIFTQTSRLTITKGNSVYFPFNSLAKMNNGISYIDWTRVTVYYNSVGTSTGPIIWRLEVVPNSANFDGDAGNTLNLDRVEIEATDGGGNLSAANYLGPISLGAASPIILVSGGPEGDATDNIVNISYYCGTNAGNRIMGSAPDYYFLDLTFTLRPDN